MKNRKGDKTIDGVIVLNAVPLVAPTQGAAIAMTRWHETQDWYPRPAAAEPEPHRR